MKLNPIEDLIAGRRVVLIDDSIVRGTTSREIVQMARDAGARKVYLASAAPPVRHPNVYGIDMPTRGELIASDRSEEEICREIGADGLIYQDLDDLKASVRALNPSISFFETSCFDGQYITGDITVEYLNGVVQHHLFERLHKGDMVAAQRMLNQYQSDLEAMMRQETRQDDTPPEEVKAQA